MIVKGTMYKDGKTVDLPDLELDDEFVKGLQEEANQIDWCECDNPDFGHYWNDGECDCGIYKHHIHCSNCGCVMQIG